MTTETEPTGQTGRTTTSTAPARHRPHRRRGAVLATVLALLVLAVAACGDDGAESAGGGSEDAGALQGLVRPEPLRVGQVALPIAATGEPRTMVAAPGELLIVYFGYLSCPDVCPTTMADLESAFAELDPGDVERIEVAFVTVDPDRDDADRLAGYLDFFFERAQGLRPESPEQLRAAEDAFLATSEVTTNEEGGVDVTHSGITYVVDDDGTVLVEWAFGTSAEVMAADLATILDEVVPTT